jgi:formate dehydrogenase subunit beta
LSASWLLPTDGEPLRTVRRLLAHIWELQGIRGFVGCVASPVDGPRVVTDPAGLAELNPFVPLMTVSTARLVPDMLRQQRQGRLGLLLRPCELRGLIETAKHGHFGLGKLFTIGVDCLSTLPPEEFWLHLARHGMQGAVPDNAGPATYRYRPACRQCEGITPGEVDLAVGVIGLPVREWLAVWGRSNAEVEQLGLEVLGARPAPADLLEGRRLVLADMAEHRRIERRMAIQALPEEWRGGPEPLAQLLGGCGPCQACMDACAITAVDPVPRQADGSFRGQDLARWLVSCDGCGMCEAVCPRHLPLAALFGQVRDVLVAASGYRPGRSVQEPVPAL